METKIENRGGKRVGAGRPFKNPKEKRTQLMCSVSPETKARLKEIADDKGIRVGRLVDIMVENFNG